MRRIIVEGDRIVAVELSDSVIPADAVRSFEGDELTYDKKTTISYGQFVDVDPRNCVSWTWTVTRSVRSPTSRSPLMAAWRRSC